MHRLKHYMTVFATISGLIPIFSNSLFSLSPSQSIYRTENKEQLDRNYADFVQAASALDSYKPFLEEGTYKNQNWSNVLQLPLSRYYTFKLAFKLFIQNNGKTIVELGTSSRRSKPKSKSLPWDSNNPETWDWEEGCFTRLAAECLQHLHPTVYTVDKDPHAIAESRKFMEPYLELIEFHEGLSVDFLNTLPPRSIDLLYIDTGEMWPLEPSARLQLEEAKAIVNGDLISAGGIILIDDVKNQTPLKYGEKPSLGKSKYSLPYLLNNGFEYVGNEYQVILRRKK